MTTPAVERSRFSRRSLVGSSLAGAALLPLGSLRRGVAAPSDLARPSPAHYQATATTAIDWRTWHLVSPTELQPSAPGSPSAEEIDEILALQEQRTDEMTAAIERWSAGPAVLPWSSLIQELHIEFAVNGMRQGRNLALLQTAVHDAAIGAWNAQVAHGRPSPAATESRIAPVAGIDPGQPTFPSEHAAVAGAAATVLAYLFPDAAAGRFDDLAQEAANSRLWAGAAFRSDIDVGLAYGRVIGERAVERGKADGSDVRFDPATMPTGSGIWQPTPPRYADVPVEPLGGSWKTWVIDGGDAVRPAPPPVHGSPAWQSELELVQETTARRTFEQEATAQWWQNRFPFFDWAHELILRNGLDSPHAARVLAYTTIAYADAVIAVWDAKYTWWTSRPITEDPDLVMAFPTPNYPAYPSGYSAVSGAAAMVIGHFFPEAAEEMADRAWEAAKSRCWAGIHYMIDNEVGLTMGRRVGRLVTSVALADGADRAE